MGELLCRVSSRELTEWDAHDQLEAEDAIEVTRAGLHTPTAAPRRLPTQEELRAKIERAFPVGD